MDLSPEEKDAVKKMRKEKAQKEAQSWQPRPAEQVPVEEKVAAFDRLHQFAMGIWNQHKDQGYYSTDDKQYAFEGVMQLLVEGNSREFWKAFNALGNGAI